MKQYLRKSHITLVSIFAALTVTLLAMLLLASGCAPEGGTEPDTQTVTETETAEQNDAVKPPYREATPEEAEKYPKVTNLPTLYINLDGGINKNKITKEQYLPATYTLVVDDGVGIYEQPLEIKGRGNYSWSFVQKPYTIKLAKRTDLLGMGAARTWVLVTTYSDKTLLRNYLTLNLAVDIGLQYSVEAKYVDVYINGKYNGLYVLTEKIQIHDERVDINEYVDGLFEIEVDWRHNYRCDYCIKLKSGAHVMYKQADVEDIGEEKKKELLKQFRLTLTVADKAMRKGYSEFSKYIDVPSFVDWYIVNEFVKNFDSGFTTSCYCYIKNGILYMGPPWDYDTCLGNQNAATCLYPEGYHVRTSPWFSALMDDPVFFRKVCERWTELRNAGVFDKFLSDIYDIPENVIAQSEQMTHKHYRHKLKSNELRGNLSKFTFKEELDYMYDWVEKRIKWLDSEWKLD